MKISFFLECNGRNDIQPSFYSSLITAAANVVDFAPFCDRSDNARYLNKDCVSFIVGLFCRRSPTAVARLVVAVVVNAVERAAFRPLPHVHQKILKGQPSFADRDATAAVSFVGRVIFLIASDFHRLPRAIRPRLSIVQRMTMSSIFYALKPDIFFLKAAAADHDTHFHGAADNLLLGAAVAAAKPRGCFATIRRALKNEQSTESLTRDINEVRHWAISRIAWCRARLFAQPGHYFAQFPVDCPTA